MTDKPRSSAQKDKPRSSAQKESKLDPNQIVDACFLAGAGSGSSLPAPSMAEIAFAGRSNVGKSSLINTLVERRGLVRTGSTPGLTRQINLFEARARDGAVFHLVDLPGYGYGRVSKAERAAWKVLIENYLRTRVTLAAVVLLVDVRRGIEDDDIELVRFAEDASQAQRRPVDVIVVATKIDKLPKASQRTALAAVAKQLGRRRVLGFSAVTADGRVELWKLLRKAALGAPETSSAS